MHSFVLLEVAVLEPQLDERLIKGGEQCVGCCMSCEDVCNGGADDCVNHDVGGAVLEGLDVERGWWRVTQYSLTLTKRLRKVRSGLHSLDDSTKKKEDHRCALEIRVCGQILRDTKASNSGRGPTSHGVRTAGEVR